MAILKKILLIALTLSVALASPVFALTVLKGADASQYLGDIQAHLLSGKYAYEILSRNHRDAMHGRFSDGVIFSPNLGKFLFLRKKDGDCIVVLNALDGREEAPVTENDWRTKIKNALSDDNNIPFVFLDGARNELAIVYVGSGTQVTSKMNDKNLLEVTLRVEGSQDMQHSFHRHH